MRVTPPVSITEIQLTSSNVAEPFSPAAYNAGTTYDFGDIVTVAADFKNYESLQAGNVGHTPLSSPLWWKPIGATEVAYNAATPYAIGATASSNHRVYQSLTAANTGNPLPVLPATSTAFWLDIGPTNKYAAFDLSRNTQTICASPLTMVIAPGQRVNTIGLLGLSANSAVITATSVFGGGTVYSRSINLNTRIVQNGFDYAYSPFSTQPSLAFFDLPMYSDIIITVTLSSTSGNVKCGSVVLGVSVEIGTIERSAVNSALNFSTITRDLYGNATLVPRRTVPKTRQTLKAKANQANKILAVREALNAVPALWTGLNESSNPWFDPFARLGIYTNFEVTALNLDFANINLEIEEI